MLIGGSSGESVGEKPPVGTYPAILVGIWDVGIQPGYLTDPPCQKVAVCWETVKRDTSGKPFLIYETHKASSYNLAPISKRFVALRGAALTDDEEDNGFDLQPMLGRAILVNVVPPTGTGKWPKIGDVMPLPEGMPVPAQTVRFESGEVPKFVKSVLERRVAKVAATPSVEKQPWGDAPPPF